MPYPFLWGQKPSIVFENREAFAWRSQKSYKVAYEYIILCAFIREKAMNKTHDEEIPVYASRGNIFADLGRPDAEEALARKKKDPSGWGFFK